MQLSIDEILKRRSPDCLFFLPDYLCCPLFYLFWAWTVESLACNVMDLKVVYNSGSRSLCDKLTDLLRTTIGHPLHIQKLFLLKAPLAKHDVEKNKSTMFRLTVQKTF